MTPEQLMALEHKASELDAAARYRVFTRTWWAPNSNYPNGREPCAGKRRYNGHPKRLTLLEAIRYCKDWNASHDPGPMSRKAEFEEI